MHGLLYIAEKKEGSSRGGVLEQHPHSCHSFPKQYELLQKSSLALSCLVASSVLSIVSLAVIIQTGLR